MFSYRRFAALYEGATQIEGNPNTLELFMITLGVQHYIGGGLSASLTLPAGHLSYRREADHLRLSGTGDVGLGLRYNFAGIWGTGGYHPSLTLHLGLGLPTGDSLDETAVNPTGTDAAPGSLLSLGLGVFSVRAELEYTQFLHRSVALTLRASLKAPLTAKNTGVTYGTRVGYHLGVLALPAKPLLVGVSVDGSYMTQGEEIHGGALSKSGGHWLAVEAQLVVYLSKTITARVLGRVPFYAKVNDRQISESFSLVTSLIWRLGGDDHDHGLRHHHDEESPGHHHGHGVKRKPPAVKPTPAVVKPKPVTVKPKPVTVKPKPVVNRPKRKRRHRHRHRKHRHTH
mgnify:CR=1 FL=1